MGVSLYLFGAPHIEADGAAVAVERRKALALLAYLAASERAHSRNALAALLWPEWDGPSARTALRRVLVTANKAAGAGALLTEQERIGLAEDGNLRVDVRDFRAALKRSRSHRHGHLHRCDDCLGWLGEATDLYTGDFLAGFGLADAPEFDNWVTFEAESLRRDVAEALEKLAEIHAARREFPQAIPFARRWLALDPLHEPAHRMLIRLYAWAGDQASALRRYRECSDLLQRELGIPPQAETRELCEQVKKGELAALSAAAPQPQPSQTERIVRLPRQPDFVGRRAELAALAELLADPAQRLVTIVGLGGMGKSSLAIAAAAQAAEHFLDGAAFVPLAALSQPSAIVFAIADALGYSFPPDNRPPLEQLTGYLSRRRPLLVLDNFEHLLEGAGIVAALWEGAPTVTFLVTSRERLHLRAETIFSLEGMAASEEDGLRLFVQSARRVRFDYTPQAEERVAIGDICRLVGGMPLGIVLAAGWMELLTAQEIAGEIRGSLDVLATDLRDVPERQQSMRAVLEQTWQRLSDPERDALMRLSVFRGGFTQEAAQAVTGASLRTLLALSNRQLLQHTSDGRYDIHELLRHFALERLAEAGLLEGAAEAHASFFVALLERSEAELKGADQQDALARLRAEHDNIRLAWAWALDHREADGLAQAVESLCLFYFLERRRSEGIETFLFTEGRLAENGPDSVALARLLVWHGRLLEPMGQREKAKGLYQSSLEILDRLAAAGQNERRARAFALCELGGAVWFENITEARQLLGQSVGLCREINDRWLLAEALCEFARLLLMDGDYPTAEEMAGEALNIRQEIGDSIQRPNDLPVLGWATLNQDQFERAMTYAREQTAIGKRLNNVDIISHGRSMIGNVHIGSGEYAEAPRELLEALALAQQEEDRHHANSCRYRLTQVHIHLGEYQAAYDLALETLSEGDAIGLPNHRGHALGALGMVRFVWEEMAEATQMLGKGVELFQSTRQQRPLAYYRVFLAYAYRAGDRAAAAAHLTSSLRWATEHPSTEILTAGLPLAALLYVADGQPERAIELHALATRYPRIANSRWFYDIAGRELESLAASLPAEVVVAAQERGKALDLFVTAQELVERFATEEE